MAILECDVVSRELIFSTKQEISHLKLMQRVKLHGSCVEEWSFDFGFVMPSSENSWQHVIKAADRDKMMDPAILSGNLVIETVFYDNEIIIAKNTVRIYYV